MARRFWLVGWAAWALAWTGLFILCVASRGRSFHLIVNEGGNLMEARVCGGLFIGTVWRGSISGSGILMETERIKPEYGMDVIGQETDLLSNDRVSIGEFGVARRDEWGMTLRGVWAPGWLVLVVLGLPAVMLGIWQRQLGRGEIGRFEVKPIVAADEDSEQL